MRVLVIVPVHDRVEFLAEALASIEAQTRKADEVVVTGNLLYDDVAPRIPPKLPTFVTVSQAGIVERLNRAIETGGCDAFAVLCDDDRLAPTFIEKTADAMERTGVDIVYSDLQVFGDRSWYAPARDWDELSVNANCTPYVTALCSRRAWERAGGFHPGDFFDWIFWWRCFYTGATALHLKEALFHWRLHSNNIAKAGDPAARARTLALFASWLPELKRGA